MSGGLDATKPGRFSRRFKRDEIRAGWWGAQNGPTPCNPFIYPGGVSGRSERRGLCNAIADHDLSAKRMGGRPAGTITWRRASFRTLSPTRDVTYDRKARRQGGWRRARLAARSKLSKEPDLHCVAKRWKPRGPRGHRRTQISDLFGICRFLPASFRWHGARPGDTIFNRIPTRSIP